MPSSVARTTGSLQFRDDDPKVRRTAFEQLCAECGVDPQRYLGSAAG